MRPHTSMDLKNKLVAILLAPRFQDDEAVSFSKYLSALGADVKFLGLQRGKCQGKASTVIEIDSVISEIHPDEFEAVLIPGGGAPETLRTNKEIQAFVRSFFGQGKPVGAICHGPQVLISAGVVSGRRLTGFPGIRDDLVNAGAHYLDEPVVTDGNLVTARLLQDLKAFNEAFGLLLESHLAERAPWFNVSPHRVIELAIANEGKAQALYEDLAKRAKDRLVKAKFKYLSEMERCHKETLTQLFERVTGGNSPRAIEPLGRSPEGPRGSDPEMGIHHLLREAILAEEAAHRLYSQIAEKVINPGSRKLFLDLAEEEFQHKVALEAEFGIKSGRTIPSAIEKEPWWSQEYW